MQFNNTSDKTISLYHDALYWAGADTKTYTIEEFTRNANFALDYVVNKILKSDRRWKYGDANNTKLPIAYTDLIASHVGYEFADSHLKVLRLRIKDKNGEYKTLKPVDRRDLSDEDLNATGEPEYYDKLGRSFLLHPLPDYGATDGIEVEFQSGSNYFALDDTTKEPGFDSTYHRLVSLLASKDYAAINVPGRLKIIKNEIKEMIADLEYAYNHRDIDDSPAMTIKKSGRALGLQDSNSGYNPMY